MKHIATPLRVGTRSTASDYLPFSLSPLLLFLLALPAFSAPQIAWTARYAFGTNSDSKVFAMALDAQHNLIVAGTSKNDQGNADYVTAKYSLTGSNLWTQRFDSGGADTVRGLALDGDGNAVLTGTSKTVKYGAAGVEQWTALYGGRGVAIDFSNNVVVTGFSEVDFATVKLTPQGSNLWVRTFHRVREDVSQVVAVDAANNVFVAGLQETSCYRPELCYANFYVMKYAANGTQLWVQSSELLFLAGYPSSQVIGLGVDGGGNVIFTANAQGSADPKFYTAKFSASGVSLWHWNHPDEITGGARMSVVDHEGNTFLTGGIRRGNYVSKTYKVAPDGNPSWLANYSGTVGSSDSFGNAIALDFAANVYVTGQSTGLGTGSDWATIKYSPTGQEQWVVRHDGALHGEDQATAIVVDNAGGIYAGGFTTTTNGIEMLIIKYVDIQNIQMQTNQNVLLQFLGTPGVSNRVQATTDFLGWLDLGFSVADTNGLLHFLDTNAPNYPFRFYRTVTP